MHRKPYVLPSADALFSRQSIRAGPAANVSHLRLSLRRSPLRRNTKPTGRTFDLQDYRVRAAVRQALKNVACASSARSRASAGPIRAKPLYCHSFATPVEFLLVAPEGVAITEFQLVRMRVNKDNREFRTVTGGVFHSQSGAVRDLIHFEGTKVAARVFCVTFPSSLGPGEYGFLPPGSAGSSGKIYSFHVIE